MTANWKEILDLCQSFSTVHDGIPTISPCLTFEAFIWYAEGPEVLDFYQNARALLGNRLTHYGTGSGDWSAITKRSETLVPTWCDNPTPWPKKQYFYRMTGADADATAASLRIDFNARPSHPKIFPASSCFLTLPLDHPTVTDNSFVEWACKLQLFQSKYFVSGSCGLGVKFPYNYHTDEETRLAIRSKVESLLSRFPGLNIEAWRLGLGHSIMRQDKDFTAQHPAAPGRPSLIRANWLTFLSEHQISHLGGLDALRDKFQSTPEIRLYELGASVCIQAGPYPQIGSRERDDLIPIYQKVGHVVQPVRLPSFNGSDLSGEFDDTGLLEWTSAFD
jgi:hypothetical protein